MLNCLCVPVLGVIPLDLQSVHQRIKDNVEVLTNFAAKHEPGRARADYMELLRSDLCTYYSSNSSNYSLYPHSEAKLHYKTKKSTMKLTKQATKNVESWISKYTEVLKNYGILV